MANHSSLCGNIKKIEENPQISHVEGTVDIK